MKLPPTTTLFLLAASALSATAAALDATPKAAAPDLPAIRHAFHPHGIAHRSSALAKRKHSDGRCCSHKDEKVSPALLSLPLSTPPLPLARPRIQSPIQLLTPSESDAGALHHTTNTAQPASRPASRSHAHVSLMWLAQ